MKSKILMNCLAAVLLTAAAGYGCTIAPTIPFAQIGRTVRQDVPVNSNPWYIPVAVSPGCTLRFLGLWNAYPVVATFGTSATDPGTVGITLEDSGAPLPIVPFNGTGLAVFQATDSSGKTATATMTVYFYGLP